MDDLDEKVLLEIRNIQMLIGRNILVFQDVEQKLKLIHNFKKGSGTIENLIKRKEKIDQLSLGRLTDESYLKKIESKLTINEEKKLFLSFNHLPDDDELDKAIKFFNEINDDRNLLVHNFTVRWNLNDVDDREEARHWLLNQYESCMQHREVLVSVKNLIAERMFAIRDYINSDEDKSFEEELSNLKENEFLRIILEPIDN